MDGGQEPRSNTQPTLDTVTASIETISREVIHLKEQLQRQDDQNKNVMIAVVVASFLVFITIAVEVILFHTN